MLICLMVLTADRSGGLTQISIQQSTLSIIFGATGTVTADLLPARRCKPIQAATIQRFCLSTKAVTTP
jgi:hypothetical protein